MVNKKYQLEDLERILERVGSIASNHYQTLQERRVAGSPAQISTELSEDGIGIDAALDHFERAIVPHLNASTGPRYYGLVTGGTTPAALAADWLVSLYDQNVLKLNDSCSPDVEKHTVGLVQELLGISAQFGGVFVSGATMANFTGLACARQWAARKQGIDPTVDGVQGLKVCILTGCAHSSILKGASMLGLGHNSVQFCTTLEGSESICMDSLEDSLRRSTAPSIVVANVGTVNTGSVDNLEKLEELKQRYEFWLHVDAAFGGFLLASESHKHKVKGIDCADSITIDCHKWLNVPYDSGILLTKRVDYQAEVFQNPAPYLNATDMEWDNYVHLTPENSRRFRALPVYMSLLSYGRSGVRDIVDRNIDNARKMSSLISQYNNGLNVLSDESMNIVCFTPERQVSDLDINNICSSIAEDGNCFLTATTYQGTPAIRAAFCNWMTSEEDVELSYDSISRCVIGYLDSVHNSD